MRLLAAVATVCFLVTTRTMVLAQQDPLPSWNDTPPKRAIVAFVERVTRPGSPELVPQAERIATFDNDGTLWIEQPGYVQLAFVIDRIKALAAQHPEWRSQQPFAAILDNDRARLRDLREQDLAQLVTATHAGMTTDEFRATVREWIATAHHPTKGKPYTQLVYQPMLELLTYLRANGFKTYIVSGGGVEFMRAWAESVYGIPPEQIIGSTGGLELEVREGSPVLRKMARVDFVDDKAGKPVAIERHIGRRPVMAFGNSDGDLQMLQWTAAGAGPRFALLVHHTDAEREWAYDRESANGRLDAAWDEAVAKGWTLVSIKDDWASVFPN
jgi:phosphoserine phosphatase